MGWDGSGAEMDIHTLPTHLFTPQMPMVSGGTEPGPKHKPRIQSRSPTWMVGLNYLNHLLLTPRVYISRKLELGVEQSDMGVGVPSTSSAEWPPESDLF